MAVSFDQAIELIRDTAAITDVGNDALMGDWDDLIRSESDAIELASHAELIAQAATLVQLTADKRAFDIWKEHAQ